MTDEEEMGCAEIAGWEHIVRHTNEILDMALEGAKVKYMTCDANLEYMNLALDCLKLLNTIRTNFS